MNIKMIGFSVSHIYKCGGEKSRFYPLESSHIVGAIYFSILIWSKIEIYIMLELIELKKTVF